EHKKDNHSRRVILRLLSHRRNLFVYIQDTVVERYRSLIKILNIRR
ncbi:30S ribosomal protein S15, partial [Francisella tularensis subsp. holarctica]